MLLVEKVRNCFVLFSCPNLSIVNIIDTNNFLKRLFNRDLLVACIYICSLIEAVDTVNIYSSYETLTLISYLRSSHFLTYVQNSS